MKVNCSNCEYFEDTNKGFGFCHKLPPLAQGSISNLATFPKVGVDWYCFDGLQKTNPNEEPQILVENHKNHKKSKNTEGLKL